MHCAVKPTIHGQVRPSIGISLRKLFIDVHAEPGFVTRDHHSVSKNVGMWKYTISLRRVTHVLLNPEIGNTQIKMQSRSHAHRTQIRSAVRSGSDVINFGKAGYFAQMRNATSVNYGRSDVVDHLLLNKLLAVIDGVEHFAHGKRCGRVLPNQPKAFLQFRGYRVFQPEEMKGFETPSQAGRFNGCQAVMCVVE